MNIDTDEEKTELNTEREIDEIETIHWSGIVDARVKDVEALPREVSGLLLTDFEVTSGCVKDFLLKHIAVFTNPSSASAERRTSLDTVKSFFARIDEAVVASSEEKAAAANGSAQQEAADTESTQSFSAIDHNFSNCDHQHTEDVVREPKCASSTEQKAAAANGSVRQEDANKESINSMSDTNFDLNYTKGMEQPVCHQQDGNSNAAPTPAPQNPNASAPNCSNDCDEEPLLDKTTYEQQNQQPARTHHMIAHAALPHQQLPQCSFVTESQFTEQDVLLGKLYTWKGNLFFQAEYSHHQNQGYDEVTSTSRSISRVHEAGGRFLKPVYASSSLWRELGASELLDHVRNNFRLDNSPSVIDLTAETEVPTAATQQTQLESAVEVQAVHPTTQLGKGWKCVKCTDRDVLLGNLEFAHSWPANKRFYQFLLHYSNMYPSYDDPYQKMQQKYGIVQQAIKAILTNGGRFLRHSQNKTGPEGLVEEAWLQLDLKLVERAAIHLIPKSHKLSGYQSHSGAANAEHVSAVNNGYCTQSHATAYAFNANTAAPFGRDQEYRQNHYHFVIPPLNQVDQVPTQSLPAASSTFGKMSTFHRTRAPWRVPQADSSSKKATQHDSTSSDMIDHTNDALKQTPVLEQALIGITQTENSSLITADSSSIPLVITNQLHTQTAHESFQAKNENQIQER